MKINPAEYKILVVDDVQSNVLLLKALLGREGFGIVYAMNGTEALEKVKSEHPDLILLDVMMPDMDGFEVAGHLKVEPEQAEIPIIFLTALNDSASVVKGFQLGANDFISKPFRREELLIRVEHQLSLVDARRVILRQTEELRKTIAGRDKLYSVIAHDLRSPMASIKMLCNTIMMSIDPQTVPGDVFEMLEMTNKTAEEVFSLLDNLLKWTKSQLGKLSNVPQPIDMVGLVDGVIEVFKPIAESKLISLELDSEVEFINVIVDIEMIKSVVRNLISNAIKFSHKNTVVMVHVKVQDVMDENKTEEGNGKEVLVTVSDRGCGIKNEDQGKLLNEATHFTTFGTNSEEGSGLGLLLCKDFVSKNHGRLWFTSEEGVGSNFNFTIPIK
ncbi:hybrid sensor histidine kinase/response regulator [Butyricimonas virosa]|jgi:two-component system sensor histidine kinase/response regulator|uniref:histidine kinase n=1 Tax=Butyricimonas virosa TaxID=544645 RepID=A0A412X7B5_9BACT|nr:MULTISPECIES: hybrid sensor histidine kinase/response regulator [Butyricimonas]RGV36897.1 hybrid sensor histidine kinase/response regulator [Butyricimonas virosa]HAM82418.1 hybrid sensor histidine kinase/response regulator [Butyricimonas sp.]HCH88199.1 hybrid sensor histidine kinase/response regulator [Butyricimonas sp.]